MFRKAIIFIISLFISQLSALAHGSWQQHAEDMYQVFGFERNEVLTNWMRFVSSNLIDNNNADCAFSDSAQSFNFYSYLQEKYPDFQCKHRYLFHWGYNSRPWTSYLENKVHSYGWSDKTISEFQNDLVAEQKRRNGFANEYTENVFGYAHGGKEARIARVLISVAYDVHILGDYEPDNIDLDGLMDIGSVVGDIINNLNALDGQESSALIKQIRKISQAQDTDIQIKATVLLNLLKEGFSNILQNAQDGTIAEHLISKGFGFESGSNNHQQIDVKKNGKTTEPNSPKVKRSLHQGGEGIGFIIVISLTLLFILLYILFKNKQ